MGFIDWMHLGRKKNEEVNVTKIKKKNIKDIRIGNTTTDAGNVTGETVRSDTKYCRNL